MGTRALQFDVILAGLADTNGSPFGGGSVEFYAAGTLDAKNVWTEKEKTNPFSSYTLDSYGGEQLYGDGEYKVIVKNAAGATIHTWDNLKIQATTFTLSTKTTTYNATGDDDVILCDTDGGAFTVNLAAAATFSRPLTIRNIGSSGNDVTIDPDAAETIDGAATLVLTDGVAVEIVTDGSTWYSKQQHGATHERAGSDEIDGDHLEVNFTPSNYTPATTPGEADHVDDLAAHLYGIDQSLTAVSPAAHASRHERAGDDQIDGDHLDIDFTPATYVPATTPAEAAHVDDLTAHLYGIDTLIADHDARHERAGADEIDGDHLDIDYTPATYVPATTPAEAANVDDLAAHLYGIDTLIADHDARHERAGADEIDGDHLDIDFTPSNYVPATDPAEAANVDDLAAHLYGIDVLQGSTTTLLNNHDARHERAGADEIDGDHLDIDFTPSNYVPATTPAEAANVDDLTAHLYGIDVLQGSTTTLLNDHDARHERAGADEIDGDHLDIDYTPATYVPATTPAEAANVDDLAAHLYGIDTLIADHDARHERAGADEIDGDHLDIDYTPTNYTPATTPAEAANVDDLAAHLYGINQAIFPTGTIMMFGQASAPTGWTKKVDWQNQGVLTISSDANGTALASGGSVAFQSTHTHGIGSFAFPNHSHDNGSLTVPNHSHGNGTLANPNHSHAVGTLAFPNHAHSNGSLANPAHSHAKGTLAFPNHSHAAGSLTNPNHTHGNGTLAGPSHQHTGPSHTHGAGTLVTDLQHTHTIPDNNAFRVGLSHRDIGSTSTNSGGAAAKAATGATAADGTGLTGAQGTGAVTGSTANDGTKTITGSTASDAGAAVTGATASDGGADITGSTASDGGAGCTGATASDAGANITGSTDTDGTAAVTGSTASDAGAAITGTSAANTAPYYQEVILATRN